MKRHIPILCAIFLISSYFSLKAQSSLWGVTTTGGNGAGSIFGLPTGNTAFSNQYNLTDNTGSAPIYNTLLESNGKLYGAASTGGANNVGVLYEYDPVTNIYVKKIDFTGTGGAAMGSLPVSLIRASSNGKIYGTTRQGGNGTNLGVIFEYIPATNSYSKIIDFTGNAGANPGSQPFSGMVEASNGKLYGTTSSGGAGNFGVLYQFDPATNAYTLLFSFTGATGLFPGSFSRGVLFEGVLGKLYGTATSGGANGFGVLFEYDLNTSTYTKLKDFATSDGTTPYGALVRASNGRIYGTTSSGGTAGSFGTIYQADLTVGGYTVMASPANAADGSGIFSTLVQASNGKLYGITRIGGANSAGAIFEYDITLNSYTKKTDMLTSTGSLSQSSMVNFSLNNKLYCTTNSGGVSNGGVIFEYDPATNTYAKKIDMNFSQGGQPNGVPVLAVNGKIYGTASQGGSGSSAAGVIYEYDQVANTYTTRVNFVSATNGRFPYGGLTQASNGKLYGLASAGGTSTLGTLYEYVPGAAIITKLVDLSASLGTTPYGAVVQATNANLYGLTSAGGANGLGVIFEYNINTTAYTDKYDFSAANGANPYGSLVIASNGKAYGLTSAGGANGLGVLFEYDITANTYTKKADLTAANGSTPYGSLIQANGNFLYGMTSAGGANGLGVIFEYDIVNSTYTKKIDLTVANGSAPYGSLTKAANGKLYALTRSGGANGLGVMFEYDPVAVTFTKKIDLSSTTGGAPGYTQLLEVCTLPTTASAITATANALCLTSPVSLNYSISAIANATSYTWTIPAGATITNSTTNSAGINFSGVAAGVYTISVAGVNICGTGTLSSKSITINALPSLSVSSGTICSGSSFTIIPTGASTYTIQGGSAVVAPVTSTNYTVTGTDANGCVSPVAVTSSVLVNSAPVITANSGAICSGGSFTIVPGGGSSYTISGGSFIVSPSSTTSYSISGTGGNGCVSTASAIATVTVNTLPAVSVNSGSICSGGSFTINPSGAASYTVTGGSFVVNPAVGVYNYSVTAVSAQGCAATNTAVASLTVNATPTLSVNSATICSGQSVTINPAGASTYVISGGNFTVSPSVTTSYSITGISAQGCAAGNTVVSTVSVNTTPTVAAVNYTVCSGGSVAIVPAGAGSYTITGNVFTVSPSATTSYSITGSSAAGCVAANTAVSTVSVYANPTIAATSGSICSGRSFTINPTGANTYTVTGGSLIVSPATNTNYSVTGTSTAGCAGTNTAVVTVSVFTTPTVTTSNYTVCAGSSVAIAANGASSYTITGGTFTVTPSLGTNSYSITGTSTAGCISSNTAVSTVTVNANPTITVNSATVCSGASVTITPTGAGASAIYTITGNNFTVTPASTTQYTVTGTSSVGCISAPVVSTVVVNTTPTITASNGTICSGASYSILTSGASSYTISGNSFNVSPFAFATYTVRGSSTAGCISAAVVSTVVVNQTPTITVNSGSICAGGSFTIVPGGAGTSGTYTVTGGNLVVSPLTTSSYSVTGTSTSNCVSTATAVSSVVVNTVPVVSISSPTAICIGQIATLTASGAATYVWVPAASGAVLTDAPLADAHYTVTGTTANGCSASATATVIVNALPVINVASGAVCPGNSFTLTPTGAVSYTYSGGSNVVTPSSTTSYSITGTDANGCTSTLSAVATVTVDAVLPVAITGTSTICAGQAAILTAGGASTYSWNTGVTNATISVSPTGTTVYSVTGMSGSCSNTATFTLSVNAAPSLSITQSSTLACQGEAVTLTAAGATTYSWITGETTAQISTASILSPGANFTVTGTDGNGCTGSAVIFQAISECLGIDSYNKNEALFSVYPNPGSGVFNIGSPKQMEIRVLNTIGQVILTQKLEAGSNTINLEDQAKGIYLIQAIYNGQLKTTRISVQ